MATPFSTSCGVPLTLIDGTDCIGDSRSIINTNIQNLGTALCTLSSINNTFIANDTNTIDLTWYSNTRTLIGDVRSDSIRYSHLASFQTLSASTTLSAEAVQPGLAKAWVRFDGTTTTPTICAAYNISSVTKSATGRYVINFTAPLKNTNYIVTGNSGMLTSGHNASVVTFFYTPPTVSSFGLHLYRNYDGAELDSQYVNVVVYSF